MKAVQLDLGVKTDPVEYRYSFDWLFRILAQEGVSHAQIGSFYELYHLPDGELRRIRDTAEEHGVRISSLFTAHRELGGFFRSEAGWADAARWGFERLIHAASVLGARTAGHNPGAVLRDRMADKERGLETYASHMKELMVEGRRQGLEALCIEPMSCLAEPPTLPEEIQAMLGELARHHQSHPETTCAVGCCADVAHGYADAGGVVRWDNMQLLEAAVPYLREIHLKNTDELFDRTFGFSQADRRQGIVDIPRVRDLLLDNSDRIPVDSLVGYLEIGGPKWGRDYSDPQLERQLRESIAYLKQSFLQAPVGGTPRAPGAEPGGAGAVVTQEANTVETPEQGVTGVSLQEPPHPVVISPSLMCADLCNLEREIKALTSLGVDMLHLDIMDTRFTPNMPLGLEMIRQLRSRTDLPLDVHLMVEDNDWFVEQVAAIGVQRISVHAESATHLDRTLTLIGQGEAEAGVALNPATPLSVLDYVADRLSFVLIMTVNPGFAGQKMVPAALGKIAACRDYLRDRGLGLEIQVDGNVSFENIPRMVAAGADNLVAGTSSLFHRDGSLAENMGRLEAAIVHGIADRR